MKLPGIQYQRYVDDVLILAQNELDLKFAKRIFFKHLNQDHLKIRPKKTFTGQTTDPLVYLGYVILSHGFAVSDSSVKRLKLNLRQKPQPLWQAYIKHWKKSFKWVPEAHLHRLVQRVQNEILGKINNPHPPAPPSPTQSANSQPKPIPYPQAPKLTQPALSTEVLSEIKTPRDHNASPRFPYYRAIGPPVPRNRNNKKSS
jgi:hypothetical protein